jgi:hypothetical protein
MMSFPQVSEICASNFSLFNAQKAQKSPKNLLFFISVKYKINMMSIFLPLIIVVFFIKLIIVIYVRLQLKASEAKRIMMRTGIGLDSEFDQIFENTMPIRWLSKRGRVFIEKDRFVDSKGDEVDIKPERSDEAIVLVHGLTGNPGVSKPVRDIFEYLKKTTFKDIYLPLVKYHGKNFFPFGYNVFEAKNKLLSDLNCILDFGYSKIYLFASSHAALQIIDMSIKDKLDKRLKLIFINPQIYTKKFSWLSVIYIVLAFFGFKSILKVIFFEKFTNWLLKRNSIKNDFGYIFAKDDFMVDSNYAIQVFLKQKQLRAGFNLSDYGHYIIPDNKFFRYVQLMINTMNQF